MQKKATIIILNYNGEEDLRRGLATFFKQSYKNYDILIIDNASKDNSVEYIKQMQKEHDNLLLLELDKNYYATGARNRAIDYVSDQLKSDILVFTDEDIKVEEFWLENLLKGLEVEDVGMAVSKVLLYYPYVKVKLTPREDVLITKLNIGELRYKALEYKAGFDKKGEWLDFPKELEKGKEYNFAIPFDDKEENPHLGMLFKGGSVNVEIEGKTIEFKKSSRQEIELKKRFIVQHAGYDVDKKSMVIYERKGMEFDKKLDEEIVDGGVLCSLAVKKKVFEEIGYFQSKYLIYYDDSEFGYRAKINGIKTKFVPSSVCYHYLGGTSAGEISWRKIRFGVRNRLWFIREYFGMIKFIYYYIRSAARMVYWFLNFWKKEQKPILRATNYFHALVGALKSYK